MSNEAPLSNVRVLDADGLYLEQVEDARHQSVGEKLLAGIEQFRLSCEFMRSGIRMQHPGICDDRVEELVEERLNLARKLEDGW